MAISIRKIGACCCGLLLMAEVAAAGEIVQRSMLGSRFRLFGNVGLTYGGDKLASATFASGDNANLRAGSGVQLNVGVEQRFGRRLSAAVSVGYHRYEVRGRNGYLRFVRLPVEVLGHYYISNAWRIGAGVRATFRPSLSGTGFTGQLSRRFDTAFGPVVEVEHLFNDHLGLKVRGVAERFRSNDDHAAASGNHLGLFLTGYF